jgi:hypothetical protein
MDWQETPMSKPQPEVLRVKLLFFLRAPISWNSKKQQILTISTIEAEYMAFPAAGKEAL